MLVPVYDIVNCGPRHRFVANGKLVHNSDSLNLQNLPSRDKGKKALKNAILAPPGHVVINIDSSQIEARVLAWWAGQDDVVQTFRDKRDIYCEDATKAFGRTITKADTTERFIGKTMRLGLGYGTGAAKLFLTLKQGGADVSEGQCQGLVRSWRDANYKITELWSDCDQMLRAMMSHNLSTYYLGEGGAVQVDPEGVRLPNGLYISYPDVQLQDGEVKYRSRYGYKSIWGGSVVENITQGLARIIIGEQMIEIQKHYPVALTVHDAAVIIVPESRREDALHTAVEIMSTPPVWGKDIPIACEAKWGMSYGDC